jgi:hypothetical protein
MKNALIICLVVLIAAGFLSCGDNSTVPQQQLLFWDDFSTNTGWVNETDGAYFVRGERLLCQVRRDRVQKMYVPIPAYTGGFTMDFDFMWDRGDGNVWLEVGLAESLSGALNDPVNDPTGAFLQLGRQGPRDEGRSYYIFPLARYRDESFYHGGFDASDFVTYLSYSEDAWYHARLEVTGLHWRLTLANDTGEEVGRKTGTFPHPFGSFKYVYIGNPDDEDWAEGLGYLDNLRLSGEVEWENPCPSPCSSPPADPMPVPTGLVVPDQIYFDEPFLVQWDHVWTGCGGYEIAFLCPRRLLTFDVVSGSTATITIPRSGCETTADCVVRLRSFWGGTCDDRVYSEPHEYVLAMIRAREDVPLLEFSVGDGDTVAIAPGDTIGPIDVPSGGSQGFCWRVIAGCIGERNVYGYRYGWGGGWEIDWTPFVIHLGGCSTLPPFSGREVLTIGIVTNVGEFYYAVELIFL